MAILSTLDDALAYYRRVEGERNEALTRLESIEQNVNILRSLLPQACANPKTGTVKFLQPAVDSVTLDPEGRYNNGYRDRVLRRLAATLTREPDPELRRWAALALGVAGDTKSVPALALALNDVNTGVRREAAVALGRIGTANVVTPLAGALRESEKEVRDKVTRALGRTGKPAIRVLISGLRDHNALVRRGSSDALTMIGAPAISPLAQSLLVEDDRLARIGAVETLGRMRSERAVAPLMMALMEPDMGMQDAAAQALVRTGRPAIGPLIRMLRVAGHPLRRRAAEVLVRTRGLAVKPLIEALADNTEVRATASVALVEIGRPSLGPLMRALNDSNPVVRQEAATALGLIGDPRAVAALIRVMKRRDRVLRRTAAEALVRLGRPAAGPLVSLLKETDAGLRGEGAWALVQIGRPAFKPLCQALLDADLGARCEAARVLSRLRSSGQLRGLHGEWEWTMDETLLLAWYNSGWAQERADGTDLLGNSKRHNAASSLMQRLPAPQKRKVDQPRSLP